MNFRKMNKMFGVVILDIKLVDGRKNSYEQIEIQQAIQI